MTNETPGPAPTAGRSRARRALSTASWGLLLGGLGLVAGALLGGLYVRLFVPRTGMGWDQLADALGGLMVGGALGALAGIALALFLSGRGRVVSAAVMIVLAVSALFTLRALREERPESEPFVRQEAFKPMYLVRMNVGKSDEILRATPPEARPVPFTEMELFTASEELELVGWDQEPSRCQVAVSRDDLTALIPRVQTAHAEAAAGHCRTDNPDDYPVSLSVNFDGQRYNATVQADCLADRPAMLALAEAIADLSERVCPRRPETTEPAAR